MSPLCAAPALAAVLLVSGCGNGLAARDWIDHRTALAELSRSAAAVRSISAECGMTLRRADGETVTLDAVLIAEPPRRLRFRAWKFDRAVFDVTATPDGVWLLAPSDSADGRAPAAGLPAPGRIAGICSILTADFFADPPPEIDDAGGPTYRLRRPWEGGPATVAAEVDRGTLTVRAYVFRDGAGAVRQRLELADHRKFGEIVWPTRITATGADGVVELRLTEVVFNGGLPADAFVPPRRAVKQGG